MKTYILLIIITLIINFINEFLLMDKNKKFKKINWFLYILSLFIICIIAGARSIDVGTDVKGYVFRLVKFANYNSLLFYIENSQSDLLFAFLVYLGNLTKNINIVLFIIELAVAVPIFMYAYLERKRMPFTLCILIFLLTMYCLSLSMMRQSIAISLTILAYHYLHNNCVKKTLLYVFVAFLFHKTALIFLVVLLISKFTKNEEKSIYYMFLIIFLLFSITPFVDNIISRSIYSNFLGNANFMRQFSIASIIKRLIFLIMWLMCLNKSKSVEDSKEIVIGTIISIISLYCTGMSFIIPGMGRLGYYFYDLSCILIFYHFPYRFKQRKLINFMMVLLYIALWWNMTAVPNDSSNVYPYKSDIVNFLN